MLCILFHDTTNAFSSSIKDEYMCLWKYATKKAIQDIPIKENNKGTIEVISISDEEMKHLNEKYRKKNTSTDVLAFSYRENKKTNDDTIGQIFISQQQIQKQATMYKTSYMYEMNTIFIHGLLHIFDFDHKKKEDFMIMQKWQNYLLQSIYEDLLKET